MCSRPPAALLSTSRGRAAARYLRQRRTRTRRHAPGPLRSARSTWWRGQLACPSPRVRPPGLPRRACARVVGPRAVLRQRNLRALPERVKSAPTPCYAILSRLLRSSLQCRHLAADRIRPPGWRSRSFAPSRADATRSRQPAIEGREALTARMNHQQLLDSSYEDVDGLCMAPRYSAPARGRRRTGASAGPRHPAASHEGVSRDACTAP